MGSDLLQEPVDQSIDAARVFPYRRRHLFDVVQNGVDARHGGCQLLILQAPHRLQHAAAEERDG